MRTLFSVFIRYRCGYTARRHLKKGRTMAKIELTGWRCERCGHEWVARQEWTDAPRVCPKCKSPYWNEPRQKPKVKKGESGVKE
jgi:predicted Zn-ribbon and HTH transcriptional regulator